MNERFLQPVLRKKFKLKNNKVSILIPTYNRSKLLFERALPSIFKQSYKNYEIIIVGDCCTDNTFVKLRELNDPRIKFINLPTRKKNYPEDPFFHWLAGPVNALNKALSMVTGDWIARIDDDDTGPFVEPFTEPYNDEGTESISQLDDDDTDPPKQRQRTITAINDGEIKNYVYRVGTTELPEHVSDKKFPIKITYVTGFADAAVPSPILNAMLILIGEMYENREDSEYKSEIRKASRLALNPYRLKRF